jgi:HPt (histidine-containing phosphotransfer) domain-containing protein
MSSPGAAGRVDFGFLDRLAAGDQALMREVLGIFLEEAAGWAERLRAEAAADVVHTVKGSGRAVGAHELGDLCEAWEMGEFGEVDPILEELARVEAEIRDWLAA